MADCFSTRSIGGGRLSPIENGGQPSAIGYLGDDVAIGVTVGIGLIEPPGVAIGVVPGVIIGVTAGVIIGVVNGANVLPRVASLPDGLRAGAVPAPGLMAGCALLGRSVAGMFGLFGGFGTGFVPLCAQSNDTAPIQIIRTQKNFARFIPFPFI